jgi:hypothetical protein
MKLGVLRRILKDDLAKSGEIPSWMDSLLQPLNEFIEKVGLALQGRLTFADNFLCKVITQSFSSGASYSLSTALAAGASSFKVVGVLLLDGGGGTVDKFKWARNSDGKSVQVTITFSDVPSATCSVVILLGQ